MRFSLIGAAFLAAACAVPAATAQAQSIEWSIQRSSPVPAGERVQLTIESRWSANDDSIWSNNYLVSELPGLTPEQLSGPRRPVQFALVRDAGRLDCGGVAGHRTGSGTCRFTANPAFSADVEARGLGRPSERQSYSLAMSRVGRDLVASTQGIRHLRPDVDDLVSMGVHGVTADYVRALASSGYRLKSAGDIVSLKIHGADLDYIRGIGAIAPQLQHLSGSDLVSLRIHGVTPDYLRELAAIGPEFRSFGADDLVSFRIHGAKPDMIRAYVQYGVRPVKGEDITSMAVHGVRASDIVELARLGYRGLSASELVQMRIHGVTPDFARALQAEGMEKLSADQLVRLRLAGFRPKQR